MISVVLAQCDRCQIDGIRTRRNDRYNTGACRGEGETGTSRNGAG